MTDAYVVTGGGRGIGRAIVERLLGRGESSTGSAGGGPAGVQGAVGLGRDPAAVGSGAGGPAVAPGAGPAAWGSTGHGSSGGAGAVVVVERDAGVLDWVGGHPAAGEGRLAAVVGDAGDDEVCTRAAALAAELAGPGGALVGWVNNAAVFRDASVHDTPAADVMALVTANLAPVVAGSAAAVRAFLAAGTAGAIVNVSSHQAARPVPGALPYATAKAAVEGFTRALAVDYGRHGIRANAVGLGTIATERYEALRAERGAALDAEMAGLHPLGRVGRVEEVADVVAVLLSAATSFVSGAVVPVDGGRGVLGRDPEAR